MRKMEIKKTSDVPESTKIDEKDCIKPTTYSATTVPRINASLLTYCQKPKLLKNIYCSKELALNMLFLIC